MIRKARTDSLLTDFSTPALSRYLRAHREGARYEVASANVNDVIGTDRARRPARSSSSTASTARSRVPRRLQAQVAEGHVRFYFDPRACHSGRHCPANEIWAYAHSTPIAGQPACGASFRCALSNATRLPPGCRGVF